MTTLDGLVISEMLSGENGKSIMLLTKELGCIYVYVRGGAKSKTALASTQLFCYSKFSLEEKRDAKNNVSYYFNSAEPIKIFYNIRLDIKKTALACYMAELISFAAQSAEDSEEIMKLTLNTLHFINEGSRSDELLKCIFEFRLLCECGHRLYLIGCYRCYKPEDDRMHINFSSGNLECDKCYNNKVRLYDHVVDKMLLHIIRYIALVDYDKLFYFRISDIYQRRLTKFTEAYVEYHCKKIFDTLKFYKLLN